MNFVLNETEKMIQDTARKFFIANVPQALILEKMGSNAEVNMGSGSNNHDDSLKWQNNLWQEAVELGWMELALPVSMDGIEGTAVDQGVVVEEIGAALAPLPYLETAFIVLPQLTKAGRCAEAQAVAHGQRRLIPAIHENEYIWNPDDIQMEAIRIGDNYKLKGTKNYVPYPEWADSWIIAARTGPAEGGWSSVSTFIVEKDQLGIRLVMEPSFDPTRPMGTLVLEDVEIAATCRIGEEGEGGQWLEQSAPLATAATCVEMLGGARQVLEQCLEYARQRSQFGKPLGSFQTVQEQLVDMFVAVESMRSAAYYALASNDLTVVQSKEQGLNSSVAKAFCGLAYRQLVERGIQVHGGMGFTWEYPLHLYYRRALALEVMYGNATHHERQIAQVLRESRTLA